MREAIFILFIFLAALMADASPYLHNDFTATGTTAQQKIHYSNVPNDGSMVLVYGSGRAIGISTDITSAQLQTKLRTIPALSAVTASGSVASGDFTVVMTGVNGPASLMTTSNNTLTIYGTELLHFSAFPGTSGTYILQYSGISTPSINASADSTLVQSRLRTISALSSVTVSGSASDDFTVAMHGIVGVPARLTVPQNTTGKTLTVTQPISGDATAITISTLVAGVATSQPTSGTWVELTPALELGVNKVQVYSTSPQLLLLGTGAAGSEVGVGYIFPNMNSIMDVILQYNSRVSIKATSTTPSSGDLSINLIRN